MQRLGRAPHNGLSPDQVPIEVSKEFGSEADAGLMLFEKIVNNVLDAIIIMRRPLIRGDGLGRIERLI